MTSPVTVSQSTCLEVLGIDARRYCAHLRAHPEIPRRRIGRLIVSAVADWMPAGAEKRVDERPAWDPNAAIAKAVGG